jgi:hypothetical protein
MMPQKHCRGYFSLLAMGAKNEKITPHLEIGIIFSDLSKVPD